MQKTTLTGFDFSDADLEESIAALEDRGGFQCPYDARKAAHMRLAGTLSYEQQQRWEQYGRLPDSARIAV